MVTYANSIRDTVQEAITSQQEAIASKLVEIAASLSVLPNITQKIDNLESKVASLEALLVEKTEQLKTSARECELLREQIDKQTDCFDAKFITLEKTVASSARSIDNNDKSVSAVSSAPPPSSEGNTPIALSSIENSELLITGLIDKKDYNFKNAAFAALHAVSNSISMDDIVSCRPSAVREQQSSSVRPTAKRPTPFFVRLRSAKIVHDMLNAKRNFTLLHTRDLDLSHLDLEDRSHVIDTNIYFNEVLHKNKYKHFQNLKSIAKKLGFKYVWHRKGSFLVKWRDGESSHVINSAADISVIANTYASQPIGQTLSVSNGTA